MGSNWKDFEMHIRKSLNYLERTMGKNMKVRGNSSKLMDRNEDNVIGTWRKGNSCL
jgi:hypothetical protein